MPLLILLPILAYILLTLALSQKGAAPAFIQAHLIIFAFIAVQTEVLSFFRALKFAPLLIGWILFLLFCGFLLARRIRASKLTLPAIRFPSPSDAVLLLGILILPGAALASALLYPPNTWDSLTYHLARVVHWIQNQSVAFYPTAITRQLYQMPLAEYGILHLQLLTGGDFFAALIQWVSFPVLICLAYLTAEELGLGEKQRLVSAAVMASLPMGIVQASSTQNDLVTAGFLSAFAFFLLQLGKNQNWKNILFASLAFGCALLTKATAYIFTAGIGAALGVQFLLASRSNLRELRRAIASLALIVLAGLTLNFPHLWRNYRLYGAPLPAESGEYSNKDLSPRAIGSNLIRNAAQHLGTPFEPINAAQYRRLELLLGAELNNSKTTWEGSAFRIFYSRDETFAGNLLHALIGLAGFFVLPFYWLRYRRFQALAYAAGTFLGWLLYSAILNWQGWGSRLHTPLFALAAPLLTIILSGDKDRRGRPAEIAALLMLLYAVPFAVSGANRPLLTMEWRARERAELYFFASNPRLYDEYAAAAAVLADFKGEVGFLADVDSPEYPLWVLTGQTAPRKGGIAFRHVGVKNPSGKILPDVQPQYVIAAKEIDKWKFWREYELFHRGEYLSVYKKK